jgi:hypothetical protein
MSDREREREGEKGREDSTLVVGSRFGSCPREERLSTGILSKRLGLTHMYICCLHQ